MDAKIETPDTTQAERWLTPDVFVYRGQQYEVATDGTVTPVKK